MVRAKFILISALYLWTVSAHHSEDDNNKNNNGPSMVDLAQDIYSTCLKDLSVNCAKPKALHWISEVADNEQIRITEDLVLVKKENLAETHQSGRGLTEDILEQFEDFLQNHDLVAKPPAILKAEGPLGKLIPRSFEAEELRVPLAATGRSSKVIKKVILPFLLGLKFKTAILVPLAITLIALKTWKALTLGLLSMVLTGALLIFKLTKSKNVNYEVIHYPQHLDHHVVDHPPISDDWDHHHHHGYAREFSPQELAYNAHVAE